MNGAWSVSLHDVSPDTWADCERLLELLHPYGSATTLLITPHFHRGTRIDEDRRFVAALRARVTSGDEVVLHGFVHLDEARRPGSAREWVERRWLTAAEGEFAALDAHEAARRIGAGIRLMRTLGLRPAGFVPPAWLLGPGARSALAASGLGYTCTRDALLRLPDFERIAAPSLVYSTRSSWRRFASRHWNRRRLAQLRSAPRIRVALHPAEARHPRVLDEWRRLLDALAAERGAALESAWLPADRVRA